MKLYIDTHCHLDSKNYEDNLENIIINSMNLGLEKIVIPGASIDDLSKAVGISQEYDMVYFASGIHPNEIASLDDNAKTKLNIALKHPKCIAVGEIGLDYHYLDSSNIDNMKKNQEDGFRYQINLAIEYNKPIIIHTRDSNKDVIKILRDYNTKLKAVIFHCFSGDIELIDCLDCPCYYGIGGVVSFKNANSLRDSLKNIPLESLLLETDAPYLAPAPHRGKINTPEYIPLINSYLATSLNVSEVKLANTTTQNAKQLFGF